MHKFGKKSLRINVIWLFFERFVRLFASFLVGVAVARYLGPEKFGFLAFGVNILAILSAASALGLDSFIVKRLVKASSSDEEASLLTTSFMMKSVAAIFFALIAAFAVHSSPMPEGERNLIYIYLVFLIFTAFDVVDFYFQSIVKSKHVAVVKSLALIAVSSCKIALIYVNAELVWFVLVTGLEALLVVIGFTWLGLSKLGSNLIGRVDLRLAIKLLRESWPMLVSSVAVCGYMKLDAVMLKVLMNDESVGVYVAATRLVSSVFVVAIIISNTIFPVLIHIGRENDQFKTLSKDLFNFLGSLGVVVALLFTFSAGPIMKIIYGAPYEGGAGVLMITSWVIPFVFFNNLAWKYHVVDSTQRLGMYRVFVGLVLNVMLNLILIPMYGLLGAAIGTLTARVFSVYVMCWFFSDSRYIAKMMSQGLLSVLSPMTFIRSWRLLFHEKW